MSFLRFFQRLFLFCCWLTPIFGRYPVIIIPGDGGCQLEAKLNKVSVFSEESLDPTIVNSFLFSSNAMKSSYDCPTQKDWYRLWLDVWQLVRSSALKCWADNIQIHYGPQTGKNRNTPGVETRVPGWGETSSVEYIDPSWSAWVLKDAGNYAASLVSKMVDSWGYERGKSVRAAPYDFRFGPPSQTLYFNRLKTLIEETRHSNGGLPVIVFSHSLGGLFALHFLNEMKEEWKAENIKAFVPLGTPWAGTTIAFNIFASGYDLGISTIDPKVIRAEQRSYETGAELLPHPVLWSPSSHVHLSTPKRNFTSQNYDDFFAALNFPVGKINHDNVVGLTTELKFPGVDVYCIYSKGIPTMSRLIYDDDDDFLKGEQPSRYELADGDGSVNIVSLNLCENWKTNSTRDFLVETKVFQDINHSATLKSQAVFDFLKTIFDP